MARRSKIRFVPRRGGDGGIVPIDAIQAASKIDRNGTVRFTFRNTVVYPSGASVDVCIPTTNPCDRAHAAKDEDGKLLNGAAVSTAIPRRYAPCEFHHPAPNRVVHQEQVYDATAASERWLAEQGLEVFGYKFKANTERAAILAGESFRDRTRLRTSLWFR